MDAHQLRDEVELKMDFLHRTLKELASFSGDAADRALSTREVTAPGLTRLKDQVRRHLRWSG